MIYFFAGFVVEFVSMPVTGGFTSAAAIIMASSQIKGLSGLHYDAKNCVDMWFKFFENFEKIRLGDTIMGLTSIAILIALKVSVYTINLEKNMFVFKHYIVISELKSHKNRF